jgi:hypothetical protein
MNAEQAGPLKTQLETHFGTDRVSLKLLPDGRAAFRILEFELPLGCSPPKTDVLALYADPNGQPEVHIKPGLTLRSGRPPRSTTSVTVEGEVWLTFSANCPWNPAEPAWLYIRRRVWRFRADD